MQVQVPPAATSQREDKMDQESFFVADSGRQTIPVSTMLVGARVTDVSNHQRTQHRRAMMRAVARSLLAERGYSGVHMRALANRCGVSAQTLYNNLGGREEIIATSVIELLHLQIKSAHGESERSGHNFMLVFCNQIAQLREQDGDYVCAIISVLNDDERPSPLKDTIDRTMVFAYRSHLQAMREKGQLKDWIDIDVLARSFHVIVSIVMARCWKSGMNANCLRDELLINVGLPLLGVAVDEEAKRIESVLDGVFRKRRQDKTEDH